MWCHPGGGAMEYDRDGYRYDGVDTGLNPSRATDSGSPVPIVNGGGNTNPAGVRYGDYWVFNATTAALESKAGATGKGVTEVDCLMCHLSNIDHDPGTGVKMGTAYNNQDRNYCGSSVGDVTGFAMNKAPALALTLTGEVLTTTKSGNGVNPSCDITGYEDGILESTDLTKVPTKESCGVCHFPDVNKPKGTGPAGNPLDFTAFQLLTKASTNAGAACTTNTDCTGGGFCDTDTNTCNSVAYQQAKGRAEFGKRGHSINDPGNPDVHLSAGMTCSDCHYALSGNFAAASYNGTVYAKAINGMLRMDHNFAKGNNRPDGKNSDQMDNTITCEACHIPGTAYGNKPGSVNNGNGTMTIPMADGTTKLAPIPAHATFPAGHIDKIDCRTCHIGENNFVKKQMLSDFSTTPYPLDGGGFERGQYIYKVVSGAAQRIGYKPLFAWQDRGHHGDDLKITPIALGTSAIWRDLATGQPYGQRFPGKAAKQTRTALGGSVFPLNSPDNGDDALIVNTATELATMISKIEALGKDGMTEAALGMPINIFTTSHGIDPIGANTLGSAASGGCAACHSATSPLFTNPVTETNSNDPCYGQPDGCKGLLFFQPKDGGIGLEQVVVNGKQRVVGSTSFPCPDGSKVNFSVAGNTTTGQAVNNVIPQEGLLCFTSLQLDLLKKDPTSTSSYFGSLKSRFSATQDTTVSRKVNFSSQSSECPAGATCTKSWNFGDGQTGTGDSPTHTYVNASGVCVGDAAPNNGIATGTCSNNGSACDTNNDCFYQVTMTITDDLGFSDSSSMPVATTEVAAVPAGEPTASVVVNTTTNAVVLTVTAGAETVDSVYIDWVDGTSSNNGTDILSGANRAYNHTYSTAPRAEKLYKIRVKVRTKSATGVYTYHYLTVNADVR